MTENILRTFLRVSAQDLIEKTVFSGVNSTLSIVLKGSFTVALGPFMYALPFADFATWLVKMGYKTYRARDPQWIPETRYTVRETVSGILEVVNTEPSTIALFPEPIKLPERDLVPVDELFIPKSNLPESKRLWPPGMADNKFVIDMSAFAFDLTKPFEHYEKFDYSRLIEKYISSTGSIWLIPMSGCQRVLVPYCTECETYHNPDEECLPFLLPYCSKCKSRHSPGFMCFRTRCFKCKGYHFPYEACPYFPRAILD